MLNEQQAAKIMRAVLTMEEQVVAIAKRDGNLQSIDHRLELLNSKLDHHAEVMWAKLDEINNSTVKKVDCDECEAEWKRAVEQIDVTVEKKTADKVSSRDFRIVMTTISFLAVVFGLISTWWMFSSNLSKAFGGP